jgi:hypothetical protein
MRLITGRIGPVTTSGNGIEYAEGVFEQGDFMSIKKAGSSGTFYPTVSINLSLPKIGIPTANEFKPASISVLFLIAY